MKFVGRIDKPLVDATTPKQNAYVDFVEKKLGNDGPKLKAGARRMAQVLGTWHPKSLTKTQLATLADITPGSGTFYDYLRALTAASVVRVLDDETIALQPGSVATYTDGAPPPTTAKAIAAQYAPKLKAGARRMLDFLIEARGTVDRDQVADVAGITRGSGTFYDYVRSLVRNGLAEEHGRDIAPSATLFMGESS